MVEAATISFGENDKRPLRLYFQDEARFGRMHSPVRCWAPKGYRPTVSMQRVREYTHVYSAVCPADGDSFSLILPYTNTEMMTIFLREFSHCYQNYRIVMVMDGAPWHKAKKLQSFENIRVIHQPPYSPEVNPVEHLWEHIRENYLGNRFWDSIDSLEHTLSKALVEISQKTETIQNLVGFHWAII